jgi:hypothetical protein
MAREVKTEHFFSTRLVAKPFYDEQRRLDPMYNLIKFTYFGDDGFLSYYLVTTRTLMSVICEAHVYLGMLSRYSLNELGFEPADAGYFLVGIVNIEF